MATSSDKDPSGGPRRRPRTLSWRARLEDHLGAFHVEPVRSRAAQVMSDRQALDSLGFLQKSQLRDRYPFPMLGTTTEKVERFCATSGTTGLPVLFGYTRDDMQVLLARQVARQLYAHGCRPGDRGYNGFGFGLWVGGLAYDLGMAELGMTNFPVGPGRSDLVVEWMRDMEWSLATVSPVFLATLIRTSQEKGIDPKTDWKLRRAVIGGQSVSRAFRDELEREPTIR